MKESHPKTPGLGGKPFTIVLQEKFHSRFNDSIIEHGEHYTNKEIRENPSLAMPQYPLTYRTVGQEMLYAHKQ
jgi:hypothetical protein